MKVYTDLTTNFVGFHTYELSKQHFGQVINNTFCFFHTFMFPTYSKTNENGNRT